MKELTGAEAGDDHRTNRQISELGHVVGGGNPNLPEKSVHGRHRLARVDIAADLGKDAFTAGLLERIDQLRATWLLASSHDTRFQRPDPRGPTRRSGWSMRVGPVNRSEQVVPF